MIETVKAGSTQERILDTAERMFADEGYAATSVRKITAKAEVNLAAVHYHFRSKEALLEAVILRRAEPANRERLALLNACELEAVGGRPSLEGVLRAFLKPSIRTAVDPSLGGAVFMRLVGRLHAEGNVLARVLASHFLPVLQRFEAALRRALPELPPEELYWRVHLAIGATTQALRGAESADPETSLDRLVRFVSAGLRAPLNGEGFEGGIR